ncbi:MAG: hypothetical protein HY760_01230 [Nitrospirae bacterium]|nr:hypothetical protein [Nitrospirota bacterium]
MNDLPAGPMARLFPPSRGTALLLRGDPEIRTLALELAASVLVTEGRVFWVDGGNAFDPYRLTEAAKRLGIDPHPLLRRLFVARAFTAHQLGAMVTRRLVPALENDPQALAVLSDPLTLCCDPDVSPSDAERVVRQVAAAIRSLRQSGYRVLVVSPDGPESQPDARRLMTRLQAAAGRTMTLRKGGREAGAPPVHPELVEG